VTEPSRFRVSQGFDVLPPLPGKAYPIPCDEWGFLKEKLSGITKAPWWLHTVGTLLVGAGLTTLITILTGVLPSTDTSSALIIAWAVVLVTGICGSVCLVFGAKERNVHHARATEVIKHMNLIEKRYDADGA